MSLRRTLSRIVLAIGVGCLGTGGVGVVFTTSAFDPVAFGDRVASSLSDERVARYAADRITNALLEQSPDLTAVRPLLLAAAQGLATSDPMRAAMRTAARSAHDAFFAEGTRQLVLSIPDVGVLLKSAFAESSPALAEKIPERLLELDTFEVGGGTRLVIDLIDLRAAMPRLSWGLLALGVLLLVAGIGASEDRRVAVLFSGLCLLGGGLLVLAILPLTGLFALRAVDDPLVGPALVGVADTALAGLQPWGLVLAGLGLLFAAASTSLLESFQPLAQTRRALAWLTHVPETRRGRALWGAGALGLGLAVTLAPAATAVALTTLAGVAVALAGARELFRLLLEAVDTAPAIAEAGAVRRSLVRAVLVSALTIGLAAAWIAWQRPFARVPLASVTGCNGDRVLCPRRVDEVVFPGAHNAMSNTEIPDWMFPHHQRAIPHQLEDGVRALLIDVHAGFAGASRIKTDVDGQRPTQEMLMEALGQEGLDAALRIRERLVGADEGRRGLYLCHGFCELGAYELTPTLAEVKDFLVRNPGEVLLVVIEDYVTPEELAAAFAESGLAERVYKGPEGPPWPRLVDLIAAGTDVIVFLESGNPGVSWLRPAFTSIQETPYTFHEPGEFSCRANRGGTDGSLFQINHWIETTPAPRPSNADLVNTAGVLGERARACRRERGMLPNVLAVDFAGRGDLLEVVAELNAAR